MTLPFRLARRVEMWVSMVSCICPPSIKAGCCPCGGEAAMGQTLVSTCGQPKSAPSGPRRTGEAEGDSYRRTRNARTFEAEGLHVLTPSQTPAVRRTAPLRLPVRPLRRPRHLRADPPARSGVGADAVVGGVPRLRRRDDARRGPRRRRGATRSGVVAGREGLGAAGYWVSRTVLAEPACGFHAPVLPELPLSVRPTKVPFTYLPSLFLQLPWIEGLPHPVMTNHANPTICTWLLPLGHDVPPFVLSTTGMSTSCGLDGSSSVYCPFALTWTIWLKVFQVVTRAFRPSSTGPVLLPGFVSTVSPTHTGHAMSLPSMVLIRSSAPPAAGQPPHDEMSSERPPLLDELPSP